MTSIMRLCLLTLTLTILGCTKPGQYPFSGADCGPNDPVKTIDVGDCTAPVG